jgi:hypothetical protein
MRARTTRLEFLIVTAGLLVLLFCSKPPQSGNAETGYSPAAEENASLLPEDSGIPLDGNDLPASPTLPEEGIEGGAPNRGTVPADEDVSERQQAPRVGAVDARNLRQSPYKDVMYGDVTVRWVWNGHRFVPQKVCVVKEKDGVSSVWSFDQPGNAIVSEIPQNPGLSQ